MSQPNDTLDALKAAQQTPLAESIAKAYTQSANPVGGLNAYDLEAPAKTLFPVLTPLRNIIPRVSGRGGIQANWRAVTGINVSNMGVGVAEGQRGGILATTAAEYMAAYRGIGIEDSVTFEADYAAEGFDDPKARAVQGTLRSLMIGEENMLLGGNTGVSLGTTPTPTLVNNATGGTLAAATWSVICVALSYDAYWVMAGANNGQYGQTLNVATAQVPGLINRTNADGSSISYGGGSGQKSAAASVTTTGSTSSIGASVTPVKNAVGYAWFWGPAGSEVLGAVTTINSVLLTAAATGAQTAASLPSSDNSTNSYVFDGILSQINKSGSGAYVKALPTGTPGTGSTLTSDGAGGIVEIDAAFSQFWALYRLSPDVIWVNSQQLLDMNKKIIASGGAPLYRMNIDGNNPGVINAGTVIGSYLNKITNTKVTVKVHPTMPPGTMMFWSDSIPYSLSGVSNILQVKTRREYYQIEWPLRTRKYEYGVYADEVLQNYFPPAFGVLTNIAAG